MKNNTLKIIAITTGDSNGIGLEVTLKALDYIGSQKNVQFIIWYANNLKLSPNQKQFNRVRKKFHSFQANTWDEVKQLSNQDNVHNIIKQYQLIEIESSLPPAIWVELMAKAALKKEISALVTGPLSKKSIIDCGLTDIGHTEIFRRITKRITNTKANDLFMTFLGSKFNVLIITGHCSVSKIKNQLSIERILNALHSAHKVQKILHSKICKKPIALLGLNPHAGEYGIIGSEEKDLLEPALKQARQEGLCIDGPLVPDAAFLKQNWSRYSLFVTAYHDQGLIPFKMIHGQDNGVHITMGLPFIRTSVDHGTAVDLFGKNKANPNSMIEAIQLALKLGDQNSKI